MDVSSSVARLLLSTIMIHEVQIALVTFVASALVYKAVRKPTSDKKPPPPGPWGFPILGHLPLLGKEPNMTFMKMREKFGDIFKIRMGSWDTVVVNGKDAIREALVKMDEDFAGRPMFESSKFIAEGDDLSFGRYNDAWKKHRKMANKILFDFSSARKSPVEDMIRDEVDILVKDFLSHKEKSFNPRDPVYLSVASVIYQICYGHQENIRENEDFAYLLRNVGEFSKFVSAGNPVDIMPWLKYLMPWKMRKFVSLVETNRELRNKKVDEHRQTYSKDEMRDLTDGLLTSTKNALNLPEERILSTIDTIFGAGFDTIATTLLWTVLLMAAHPEVQERVQQELDEIVGCARRPNLQDRGKLTYTEAVLHEINRFVSLAPLALPHSAIKDTQLGGYSIKKDTVVFVNLYSMGHDKEVWGDPDVFRPGRFINDAGQINKSLVEEFIPFSTGRRKCLGEALARTELFLFFSGLLQRCSIHKPPEVKEYSMDIQAGLTRQCLPYTIQVKPRY